jgi:hypothetical protein
VRAAGRCRSAGGSGESDGAELALAAADRFGEQEGQSGALPGRSPSASKTAKQRLQVTWAMTLRLPG